MWVAGMDYLHASGVVHGDLKTANVLLKSTTSDARGFICKVRSVELVVWQWAHRVGTSCCLRCECEGRCFRLLHAAY